MVNNRIPIPLPNSKEFEMLVLSCMLSNINGLTSASELLNESDFYFAEHKIIFQLLRSAHKQGKPTDIHLISQELKSQEKLEDVGGVGYLVTLAQYAGTSAYIEAYVEEIKKLSLQRHRAQTAESMLLQAISQKDPSQIIIEYQEALKKIEEHGEVGDKFLIRCIADFNKNWLQELPPPKKMLFEYSDEQGYKQGFIPKGNVCMVVGKGGIGKSHWISQLSVSVSTETLFLDMFSPTTHSCGAVFLGLAENDMDDIRRLLYKSSKHIRQSENSGRMHDLTHRIFPFSFQGHQCQFIKDGEPSSYFYQLKRRLISCAPAEGWSLVIFDPISRFLGTEAEMDNAAATAFIALMEQLAIDLPGNPTILFCHHMNKNSSSSDASGQEASRGSSAITDGVRLQINLRKPSDEEKKKLQKDAKSNLDEMMIMTMSKSNFTKILQDVHLYREDDGYLTMRNARRIPINKK